MFFIFPKRPTNSNIVSNLIMADNCKKTSNANERKCINTLAVSKDENHVTLDSPLFLPSSSSSCVDHDCPSCLLMLRPKRKKIYIDPLPELLIPELEKKDKNKSLSLTVPSLRSGGKERKDSSGKLKLILRN